MNGILVEYANARSYIGNITIRRTGKTNRQIGKTLGISDKAVEKHLSETSAKLNVSSRAAVAAWTVWAGLG